MSAGAIAETFLDLHTSIEYLSSQYHQTLLAPECVGPGSPEVNNIDTYLDHLKNAQRNLQEIHDQLGRELKADGYTWQDIANIFGIGSRQAAQQTFRKKPTKSQTSPADEGTT